MGIALYQDNYFFIFYNVLYVSLCPLLRSCCCCRCCCRLPFFVAAPLLIAAAAVGCLAAPSAAGCTSCSASRAAPSSSDAAAAADPGQDNSLQRCFAFTRAHTCHRTIGTSQQTTVPAKQAQSRQKSVAASLNIVQTLIRSSDEERQTGSTHPDCPCPPIAVLQPSTGADKNNCLLAGQFQKTVPLQLF